MNYRITFDTRTDIDDPLYYANSPTITYAIDVKQAITDTLALQRSYKMLPMFYKRYLQDSITDKSYEYYLGLRVVYNNPETAKPKLEYFENEGYNCHNTLTDIELTAAINGAVYALEKNDMESAIKVLTSTLYDIVYKANLHAVFTICNDVSERLKLDCFTKNHEDDVTIVQDYNVCDVEVMAEALVDPVKKYLLENWDDFKKINDKYFV